MYCVRCGEKAEKGQKVCSSCGMRLISPEALLKLLKKADLEKKLSSMDFEAREKEKKEDAFVRRYMDKLSKEDAGVSVSARKKAEKTKTAAESKKSDPPKRLIVESDVTVKKKKTADSDVTVRKKTADSDVTVKKKKTPDTGVSVKRMQPDDKASKRVTPLFENPTQPKRRSIFDDTDDFGDSAKKKAVSGGGGKPDGVKKVKGESSKKPASAVKLPEKKKSAKDARKAEPAYYISDYDERPRRRKPDKMPPERPSLKRPERAKTQPVKNARPKGSSVQTRNSGGGKRKKDDDSFTEKHLRSIISMVLLTITVVLTLMWGYSTESGLRTMAQFGLGSRKGYILLGDDCMMNGNYKRAVEHYYKALSKKVNYEAGIKLSWAYKRCGDIEKETSALLLLMDQYKTAQEPYDRMLELYPYPDSRPEPVKNAISMYENGNR